MIKAEIFRIRESDPTRSLYTRKKIYNIQFESRFTILYNFHFLHILKFKLNKILAINSILKALINPNKLKPNKLDFLV